MLNSSVANDLKLDQDVPETDEDGYMYMGPAPGRPLNFIKEEEYLAPITTQPNPYVDPATLPKDRPSQVVQELQQKFTVDQISDLTQILQKLQVKSGSATSTSPAKDIDLNYLVSKTDRTLSDTLYAPIIVNSLR